MKKAYLVILLLVVVFTATSCSSHLDKVRQQVIELNELTEKTKNNYATQKANGELYLNDILECALYNHVTDTLLGLATDSLIYEGFDKLCADSIIYSMTSGFDSYNYEIEDYCEEQNIPYEDFYDTVKGVKHTDVTEDFIFKNYSVDVNRFFTSMGSKGVTQFISVSNREGLQMTITVVWVNNKIDYLSRSYLSYEQHKGVN